MLYIKILFILTFFLKTFFFLTGHPWWLSWSRIRLQCGRPGFDPWVGKIPRRRERLPSPVFWPGEFHGLCSPRGCKELDMTEWLALSFLKVLGNGIWWRLLACYKAEMLLCQLRSAWSRLWFFQWSCMDVRVGLWRKLSAEKLMLLNCGVGEDSWESLGLQGDPTSPS